VTDTTAATYADRVLFGPLGIHPSRWNGDGQGIRSGAAVSSCAHGTCSAWASCTWKAGADTGSQIVPRA